MIIDNPNKNNTITTSVGNIDSDERSFINDLQAMVSAARDISYRMANLMQVTQNWLIGWRIVEQEQQGKARADYGKHVITLASQSLSREFGQGFSETQIRNFRKFYLTFKDLQIQQTMPAEFTARLAAIQQASSAKSIGGNLSMPIQLSYDIKRNLGKRDRTAKRNLSDANRMNYRLLRCWMKLGKRKNVHNNSAFSQKLCTFAA